MTDPENLTPLQIAVMRVLWERGEARVSEVQGALRGARELAASTVATLLRRLEARGLVAHRTQGRQFVYRALVDVDQARSSAVGVLAAHLFDGDLPALVAHLLASHELDAGDLARVRALIEDAERKLETEKPDGNE